MFFLTNKTTVLILLFFPLLFIFAFPETTTRFNKKVCRFARPSTNENVCAFPFPSLSLTTIHGKWRKSLSFDSTYLDLNLPSQKDEKFAHQKVTKHQLLTKIRILITRDDKTTTQAPRSSKSSTLSLYAMTLRRIFEVSTHVTKSSMVLVTWKLGSLTTFGPTLTCPCSINVRLLVRFRSFLSEP